MHKAYIELVKCRLREFFREPSASVFVFTMPILMMVALGFAFNQENVGPKKVGLASQAVAMHPYEHQILDILGKDKNITLVSKAKDELLNDLSHNKLQMIVDLMEPEHVRYLYDKSFPGSFELALEVDQELQKQLGRSDVLATQFLSTAEQQKRYVDFLIPGLIAFSALTTSLFGLGMTLVAFRRDRLFKRFATTPLSFGQLLLSFITGRYLIFIAELAIIWIAGRLIFDFKVAGNPLAFIAFAFLGVSALGTLAVLLGSRLTNTGGYNGMVNALALPLVIFSGVYFSLDHLPTWASSISQYTPLTAYVDGLRAIALDGMALWQVWPQALVLVIYGLLFSTISAKVFRWY